MQTGKPKILGQNGLVVTIDGHESSDRSAIAHQLVHELNDAGYNARILSPRPPSVGSEHDQAEVLDRVNRAFADLSRRDIFSCLKRNQVVVLDGFVPSIMAGMKRNDISMADVMKLDALRKCAVPDFSYCTTRDDVDVVASLLTSSVVSGKADMAAWLRGEVAQVRNAYLGASWALKGHYEACMKSSSPRWRVIKNLVGRDDVVAEMLVDILRATRAVQREVAPPVPQYA